MSTEKIEYSKCMKCLKNDWCKVYDNTDLSLNDCNDFIPKQNITQNVISIFFESDYDTAKRFSLLVNDFVSKYVGGKLINVSYTDLETNTH